MNDKKQQTEVTGFIQRFHNQCTSRVVDQFANNLSWHFATILKNTFNRGEVLYNPTTDQFVWRDTDDTEYTIDKSQYMSDDCVVPAEYLTEEQLHGIIFPRIYPYQEKWLAEGMEVQTQELQKMFGESYTKYTPLIEFNNRMYFNLTEEDEEGFMIFTAGYCYHYAKLLQTIMGYGEVALCFSRSHCVWFDPGKGGFDFYGVFFDTAFFIPERYWDYDTVVNYSHVPQWDDEREDYTARIFEVRALVAYLKEHPDEIPNLKYIREEITESEASHICVNLDLEDI